MVENDAIRNYGTDFFRNLAARGPKDGQSTDSVPDESLLNWIQLGDDGAAGVAAVTGEDISLFDTIQFEVDRLNESPDVIEKGLTATMDNFEAIWELRRRSLGQRLRTTLAIDRKEEERYQAEKVRGKKTESLTSKGPLRDELLNRMAELPYADRQAAMTALDDVVQTPAVDVAYEAALTLAKAKQRRSAIRDEFANGRPIMFGSGFGDRAVMSESGVSVYRGGKRGIFNWFTKNNQPATQVGYGDIASGRVTVNIGARDIGNIGSVVLTDTQTGEVYTLQSMPEPEKHIAFMQSTAQLFAAEAGARSQLHMLLTRDRAEGGEA